MCRKSVYLILFLLVLGLSARIAYADAFLQDPGPDGIISMEAEKFDKNTPQGGKTWDLVTSPVGFTGTGAMRAMPNTGTGNNTGYVTSSPRLDYKVIFKMTGTYYIWVRAYAPDEPTQPPGNNDSLHAGLDNTAIDTCDRISGFGTSYTWTRSTMDPAPATFELTSPGPHTFNIWMREDGAIVDKIVLTTNPNYTPTGDGPPQSPRGLQLTAYAPDPPQGAQNVSTPLVKWTGGETAAFHDVYFGTNPTPGLAEFKSRQTFTMYWHGPGLTPGVTYYWRVDGVEGDGVTIHKGDVWSFTSTPTTAHSPNPRNGGKWVKTDADLNWGAGFGAIMHDVYFGTNETDVANGTGGTFKVKQPATTYDPGNLQMDTTYYWRIDEYDTGGKKYTGVVWRFTTVGPSAGIRGEYYKNMNLSGAPVLTRVDPGVNFNWAAAAPDPVVGVDQFSVRWTGEIEAPFSEPFTFITGSDDGVRLYFDGRLIINNWTDHSRTENSSQPIQLVAGRSYMIVMEFYENGGDAVAQLYWQSPSQPREAIPEGPLQLPLKARNPRPADGATDVKHTPTLRWSAGEKAVKHNVYLGTDATAVANATTASAGIYRGQQDLKVNSYVPSEAPLAWNSTYYWRIDEVNVVEPQSPWKGSVWSFTTANFLVVDDFEDYTDDVGSRIFQTWKDGWGYNEPAPGYPGNGTGSAVGYSQAPFAELITVHGGGQSMPLGYDNSGTTGKARYSETQREWTSPQDWTVNSVKALTLYVQGIPLDFLESPAGTFTMSAEGTDIWGTADEFRYMYKQLSGDGEIVARVDRIAGPGTNTWAKAGVMIRETVAGGSTHAFCCMTPGNGKSFQNRTATDGTSYNTNTAGYVAPYWVKLVRQGNKFSGYHSSDGVNWELQPLSTETPNPQTINMAANVLIGLAFTSHENDVLRMAQFSNVSTKGTVTGTWTVADIASTVTGTNSIEPLYVAVEDNTAKVKVVTNANPLAAVDPDWQEWNIELSQFSAAGVNLKAIKKMYIGLGSRTTPKAGGTGTIFVDDIRVYPSRCIPSMGKPAADLSGNCVVDYLDLDIMAQQWLQAIPPATALSADLNADKKVDLKDYAKLADSWLEEVLWP